MLKRDIDLVRLDFLLAQLSFAAHLYRVDRAAIVRPDDKPRQGAFRLAGLLLTSRPTLAKEIINNEKEKPT